MSEILSYYLNVYGKPIPNSLKKGIAECFVKFDEFSLAKYNRSREVNLKDILNLVHPKPEDNEQSSMFRRLLENKLQVPFTWETMLSREGNNKKTWEKLIESGRLGYMAVLRNLRNIIKADPDNIDKVYDLIENKERVFKSRQLPFRYYSAFKILSSEGIGSSKVYDVLEKAIRYSTENIEKLKGKTFISTDVFIEALESNKPSIIKLVKNYIMKNSELFDKDDLNDMYNNSNNDYTKSAIAEILCGGNGWSSLLYGLRIIKDKNSSGYSEGLYNVERWISSKKSYFKIDKNTGRVSHYSLSKMNRDTAQELSELIDENGSLLKEDDRNIIRGLILNYKESEN